MDFLRLLAGDIGGTNTRLQLWQQSATGRQLLQEGAFRNRDYASLEAICQEFLPEGTSPTPHKACFAVAGPVDKQRNYCDLTNLNWQIQGSQLSQKLGIEQVALINDFEAVGYGVLQLDDSGKEQLQIGVNDPGITESAPIGVIGAGTGLGQAFLILEKQGEQWRETVYPTEGGHVDFAPRSADEFALLQYLQQRHSLSHISAERVISGPGIVAIYQFLRDTKNYSELPEISAEVKAWEASGSEPSKAPTKGISEAALAEENQLSIEAMKIFASTYGAEVGNFALKTLPYRGLYVAGGIAPKNFSKGSWLQTLFLHSLRDKGRMQPLIEKLPIYLVTNQSVGLLGAVRYAATKI